MVFNEQLGFWILTGLILVVAWFLRGKNSEHQEMYEHYKENKDNANNLKAFKEKLDAVEDKLNIVESNSKMYWTEHKVQMETNQRVLIEKLNSNCTKQDMIEKHITEKLIDFKQAIIDLQTHKADK